MKKYRIMTPKGECLAECVKNSGELEFYLANESKLKAYYDLTLEEIVPEIRKLYAYCNNANHTMRFSIKEHEGDFGDLYYWKRAPEYDIEYGEDK